MDPNSSMVTSPRYRGYFSYWLSDTTVLEVSYRKNLDLIGNLTPSLSSGNFYYIKLYTHAVKRMIYLDEDGDAAQSDEVFSDIEAPYFLIPYSDEGDQVDLIENNLLSMLSESEEIMPESLATLAPILASFASVVTPVSLNGGCTVVKPFVLDVKFVELKYYDRDSEIIDQEEFERLRTELAPPLAETMEEEEEEEMEVEFGGYDSGELEKVEFEKNSKMNENCSICFEDFEVGFDVTRLPCSHVYHERCIERWLMMEKRTCPTCRYELKL